MTERDERVDFYKIKNISDTQCKLAKVRLSHLHFITQDVDDCMSKK